MPRGMKKENLPIKMCVTCQRPFNWRKKWERCWDEVTTCSKSCNNKRKNSNKILYTSESNLPIIQATGGIEEEVFASTDDDINESEGTIEAEECIDEGKDNEEDEVTEEIDPKAAKKAAKKLLKAEKRGKRMGNEDSIINKQKPCDLCSKKVDLLIRCQIDQTKQWNMVCGKCWHVVSGGVVDGDSSHPYYKYGGLWKNRAAE